jgi:hypothetical protein
MVSEAKERLTASRRAIHEAKASALSREIAALNSERDDLGDQLANGFELNRSRQHANWLKKRFGRWLA